MNPNRRLSEEWIGMDSAGRAGCCGGSGVRRRGFTLVEILVTISIIALLAGLVVGLAPVATKRMREARMEGQLTELTALIEDYREEIGFYPPDNPADKAVNPLFYELSGTVFRPRAQPHFQRVNGTELLTAAQVETIFGVRGFSNSARSEDQVKFKAPLKQSQFKPHPQSGVVFLVAPMNGPAGDFNLWHYDSSSANRHNSDRYDLWADVYIAGKAYRFSNWSKEPIPLP